MRQAAGMTQRDLAKKLRREHSFVSRMELGDRRLDAVEFFWICQACGEDPVRVAAAVMREFKKIEAAGATDRGSRRGT